MENTKLIEAIVAAQTQWQGCDWRHELQDNDGEIVGTEDAPQYCEDDNPDCAYCVRVSDDAKQAEALADEAITEIEAGSISNLYRAQELLRDAQAIEDHYGDSPAYRTPLQMMQGLIEYDGGELPKTVIARWDAADWNEEKMIATSYRYEDMNTLEDIELTEAQAALYSWGQCEETASGGCQGGTLS